MPHTFPGRLKIIILTLFLTTGVLAFQSGFGGLAFAQINPEDIMEELMGEIRDEINQDIKTEVRRQTTETVAEEELSPSNTFSGVYFGILDDGVIDICNVTITQTSITGSCTNPGELLTVTPFGGDLATGFTFSYVFTESDPPCGPDTGMGTATLISGTGEPGTTFKVTLAMSMTSGCITPEVIFYVKQ